MKKDRTQTKKWTAILIAATMLFSDMMPMTAEAAQGTLEAGTTLSSEMPSAQNTETTPEKGKTVYTNMGLVDGWDSTDNTYDYIWFGEWPVDGVDTPLKWKVLDDQTNTGIDGYYMLHDYAITGIYFEKTPDVIGEGTNLGGFWSGLITEGGLNFGDVINTYIKCGHNTLWLQSDARMWCSDFAGQTTNAYKYETVSSAFSFAEQEAILATSKTDNFYQGTYYSIIDTGAGTFTIADKSIVQFAAYANILNGDKVFLPSAQEMQNPSYGFSEEYISNQMEDLTYLLRSYLYADSSELQVSVMEGPSAATRNAFSDVFEGELSHLTQEHANVFGVRPAFNLSPNVALFTMAADNSGQQKFGMARAYDGREWKLTLKDSNSFVDDASISKTILSAGEEVTVTHKALSSFTGAEYTNVTAALVDGNGNVAAYGSISNDVNATSTTFTIPMDCEDGAYTLMIMGEDWNEACHTNYATGAPYTADIVVKTSHSHCIYGDVNCSEHEILNSSQAIFTKAELQAINKAGFYHLVRDIDMGGDSWSPVDGVSLCLNGYEIRGVGDAAIQVPAGVKFTITDCKDDGQVSSQNGSGIACVNGGECHIYGGVLGGRYGVHLSGESKAYLYVAPSMEGGTADFYVDSTSSRICVAKEWTNKPVDVYTVHMGQAGVFTSGWATHMASATVGEYFSLVDTHLAVLKTDSSGELCLIGMTQHYICGASCNHGINGAVDASHMMDADTQWTVFDGSKTTLAEGFYYLTQDITLTQAINISGDVLLCLNGKTLTQTTANDAIVVGGNLTLCDCSAGEPGMITSSLGSNVTSAGCGVNVGGTFTMYGGQIKGFTRTAVDNAGAGVRVNINGAFNMYGGTISNNTAKCSDYTYNGADHAGRCYGGGVGVYGGMFNMYGGTISGNTARYIGKTTDGYGKGGGVYIENYNPGGWVVEGTFNMYGGTIINNTADAHGGGVWIESGSMAKAEDGTRIEGNTINSGATSNVGPEEISISKTFPVGSIKAQGYTGVYDGQSHSITLTYSDGATATYAADHPGITYVTTNPSFKDVGTHIIYYKVSQTDYRTVSGSAQIIITPGTLTAVSGVVTAAGTYGTPLNQLTVTGPEVTCGGQTVEGRWTLTGDTVPVVNDIGSYTATFVPTAGASNYYPLTQEVVLQISPVKLTVTAENKSKEYGNADPVLSWKITSGTMVGNETLTGIRISRATGEKAGSYPITVTQLPGANPNYDITLVNGTLTITQAIPTVPAPEAKNSITYGAKLSTVGLTEGWTWVEGDIEPTVINNGYMAYYLPTDTEAYNWAAIRGWNEDTKRVERIVFVTVDKASPSYTIPTGLTATYGQILADVTLPTGWTWKETTTSVGQVGTKTFAAVYAHDTTGNYSVVEMELSVAVVEADPDYDAPTANTLTYTGVDQSLITAGSANDGTMEYALGTDAENAPTSGWSIAIPVGKDVDIYYVWYRVVGDSNHSDVAARCNAVTINKAVLTVKANDNTITYGDAPAGNGVTYGGFVNNETEEVLGGTLTYEYTYAQYGNVGDTYEITPKGLTSDNYAITFAKGTLTVEQKEIGISWSNTALTYDGHPQKPAAIATGLVNDDQIELMVGGAAIDASATAYTAVVTGIDGATAGNYKLPDAKTSQFTIGQKELTIVWGNGAFTYDGTEKFPEFEVNGIASGDDVELTRDGAQTSASVTPYTATITGMAGADIANYKLPANVTREFTIGQATPDLGTVAVSGVVKDTTAPADVVLTRTGSVAGGLVITESAMLADKSEYTYTFTPEDANYKEITGQVQIDVLDTVVPEIIVEVDELEWKEFLNNITFGLFFKNTQQVTITSADNEHGSGLKDTLYHISDKELSAEELGQVEWTAYTEAFDIDPDAKVVIYAKASDNDGNSATISSEGMILDQTAPVAGITHNGIYYGDITFAVSDELAGLKEVTVDDIEVALVEGTYTIAADNKEHTIVVSDQAGNVIEYTITVYKKEVTNVGDGKLTETTEVLMDKIPFTEEEQQAIDQGADVVIRLEIQDATATASAEDKALIATKAGEDKVGIYLDITMHKQVGTAAAEKLTTLGDTVKITFTLPDALINTDPYTTRTYSIIRIHNGAADSIAPVYDAVAKTLSFLTDRFSTYAVVYSDVTVTPPSPVTPPSESAPGESAPSGDSSSQAPSGGNDSGSTAPAANPDTGDNSHLGLWVSMALISCGALVVIDRKKRYHAN